MGEACFGIGTEADARGVTKLASAFGLALISMSRESVLVAFRLSFRGEGMGTRSYQFETPYGIFVHFGYSLRCFLHFGWKVFP